MKLQKKLRLDTETLQVLSDSDSKQVAGAWWTRVNCDPTVDYCPTEAGMTCVAPYC
jgi:hypothetical protein